MQIHKYRKICMSVCTYACINMYCLCVYINKCYCIITAKIIFTFISFTSKFTSILVDYFCCCPSRNHQSVVERGRKWLKGWRERRENQKEAEPGAETLESPGLVSHTLHEKSMRWLVMHWPTCGGTQSPCPGYPVSSFQSPTRMAAWTDVSHTG